MASIAGPSARASVVPEPDFRTRLQDWLPKLVLSPSLAAILVFVYGFILYSLYLSFTDSKMLPSTEWVGWDNYRTLWGLSAWHTALVNLAVLDSLYLVVCTAVGLLLAIFLDQKIRGEGVLRPITVVPYYSTLRRRCYLHVCSLDGENGWADSLHVLFGQEKSWYAGHMVRIVSNREEAKYTILY